jgi:hypothetical protein
MKHAGKIIGKRAMRLLTEHNSHYFWNKLQTQIKDKEMKKTNKNKTKNQVIVVPTTQKTIKTKALSQPRSARSKTNTLAYYNCLIEQIANPGNDKVKITKMCQNCKHNKGQVAAAQQEHKQQLVQQLAKNYKAFGQSLGHYLQADIMGCLKEK